MKTATPLAVHTQTLGGRSAHEVVRPFALHRDEIERHHLISADGYDTVVTTVHAAHGAYLTGAYPVQNGYLVMISQPYFETLSATMQAAADEHEQLVRALTDAGIGIVRARRRLAARQHAEQLEAITAPKQVVDLAVHSPR